MAKNTINSLAVSNTVDSTGVTNFVQEAAQVVDVLGDKPSIRALMPLDKNIQDLTNYLSRPVSIQAGTMAAGVLTPIWNANMSTFSTLSYFKNGVERMGGVFGMRYTMVFTLQISATPFHQGVFSLNWQYRSASYSGVYFRGSNFFSCTNVPHVRLDLSTDTMVQLKVPFLSVSEYGMVVDQNSLGRVFLTPLCTIPSVAGLAAPSYQIFLHLEDVELFGAMPQNVSAVIFQSGKKLAPITEEFETEAYPFSSSVHALSRAVKWVSKGVPSLSSVGGPTAWFLQKAAGAIRAFGFSRPQIVEPISRTFAVDNVAEHNVDVPSACQVCGPIAANMLRTGPEFGCSDIDEMALKYITSQWSQINNFNLDTTTTAGTLIYAAPTCPLAFWFRKKTGLPNLNIPAPTFRAGAAADAFYPSTLFHMATMFRYWRGTLKFRFTVSKTKMHSGRIMATYTPGLFSMSPGAANAGYVASYGSPGPDPFGYSAIYNLRDGNIFEFEVPFIAQDPYICTDFSTGTVSLHVVDPVLAPAIVSNTVQFIVEVSGGEDFEFANVRTPLYPAHPDGAIVLQSGKLLSACKDNVSEFTVGESITSLRQLIGIPKVQVLALAGGPVNYKYPIPPWYYQPLPSKGATRTSFPRNSFGFGGNIASCFTFARGGTDFHAYPAATGSGANLVMTVTQHPCTDLILTTGLNSGPSSANPRIIATKSSAIHARLPAYQRTVRVECAALNTVMPAGSSWNVDNPPTTISSINTDTATLYTYGVQGTTYEANVKIYTSSCAADDASLAMYIGPPPLGLLSIETANPYDPDDTLVTI